MSKQICSSYSTVVVEYRLELYFHGNAFPGKELALSYFGDGGVVTKFTHYRHINIF